MVDDDNVLVPRTRLRDKVLELLKNRPRTLYYVDIEAATGLTTRWLEQFANGKIKEPSCIKLETLYVFLSGNELDV